MSSPASVEDPLRRLDELIVQVLPLLARPGLGPPTCRPPAEPITVGEASGFLRALDAGLFELGGNGLFRPRRMRPSNAFCYSLFNWYSKPENTVSLWREWLTHGAAPAILHLDHGYPLHDIALEVDAFDLLVYSPLNQPHIAVEVKKSQAELDRMLGKMHSLTQLRLPASYRRLANYEQKYRGLLALRPSYFLALAPGISRCFEVCYPPDRTSASVSLQTIECLPDGDAVEPLNRMNVARSPR